MSSSLAFKKDSITSSTLDIYENLGAVGEGSYGLVLKCRHRPTGQLVALKRFIDTDEDRAVRKIAAREIRFLRSLNHDNVVTLLDVFKRARRLYLVFEYVEFSLLDYLDKSGGGLAPNTVRKFLYQIVRALNYMHDQNVIHRDLKPENILITDTGFVKVCDFGFARSVSMAYSRCYTEYVATRWYRAPELLIGDARYNKPVDLWAVGCMIPEMVDTNPLYPGSSDVDQLYQIVRSCGELCIRHKQLIKKNPAFVGWKWPRQKERYMIERRIRNKGLLKIAKECLKMDPSNRYTAKQILSCEYFRDHDFQNEFANEFRRMIRTHKTKNPHLRRYSITKDSQHEKIASKKHDNTSKSTNSVYSKNYTSKSYLTNKESSEPIDQAKIDSKILIDNINKAKMQAKLEKKSLDTIYKKLQYQLGPD